MKESTTMDIEFIHTAIAGPLLSLLPLAIISVPFAIGCYFLARRIEGESPGLWAFLSIVPIVNYFFWVYVMFKVIFTILDRLPGQKRNDI